MYNFQTIFMFHGCMSFNQFAGWIFKSDWLILVHLALYWRKSFAFILAYRQLLRLSMISHANVVIHHTCIE